MNQNKIPGEGKSRLRLGNASHFSDQDLLSSCLLCKNWKTKEHKIIILPVVLHGFQTWYLAVSEEHRLC
jgi:hypothetical protein